MLIRRVFSKLLLLGRSRVSAVVSGAVSRSPMSTSSVLRYEDDDDDGPLYDEDGNPETKWQRLVRALKYQFENVEGRILNKQEMDRAQQRMFPDETDILIIGGGAIGSSIAYWFKRMSTTDALRVVVIEKDDTYRNSATVMELGAIRQMFNIQENIQMSLYGSEFIRNLRHYCGNAADPFFTPCGYLELANDNDANSLVSNAVMQRELGVANELLSREQLSKRFPFMNFEDVAIGCLGIEKQGYYDAWGVFTCIKGSAEEMGAQYVNAEAVDFNFHAKKDIIVDGSELGQYQAANHVVVRMPNGTERTIQYSHCIIAAGHQTPEITRKARMGYGDGLLSVKVPIEARRRFAYQFYVDCDNPPGIEMPMVHDTCGMYYRRDGLCGHFMVGISPPPTEEPPPHLLRNPYDFFREVLMPKLAKRVPLFANSKPTSYWDGFYDYNYYDGNGIVGMHPYYMNMHIASGFSGFGIQQAPAVGRGVAEFIYGGGFRSMDLFRLGFDRLIVDKPMTETAVY